jgi:site-specific recombinase XerC
VSQSNLSLRGGDSIEIDFSINRFEPILYPDAERYPIQVLRENYELLCAYLKSLQADAENEEKILAARGALQHALLAAGQDSFRALDFGEWRRRLQITRRLDGSPELLSESRIDVIFDFMRPLCRWLIKRYPKKFRHWDRDKVGNVAPRGNEAAYAPVRSRSVVTLDKACEIAALDVGDDPLLLRDQAVACLQWVSGARVESIATLPLRAFTFSRDSIQINMDPKLGVKTKGGGAIKTTLLPIAPLIDRVTHFYHWLTAHGAGGDAMFFNELIQNAEDRFTASNAPAVPTRAHTLAKRYQKLYQRLGWHDFSGTHGFRRGHISYALACSATVQNSLVVCNNVGHNFLSTTLMYNEQTDSDRLAVIGSFTLERFQQLNRTMNGLLQTSDNAAQALDLIEAHIRETTKDPTILRHLLRDLEGLRESVC